VKFSTFIGQAYTLSPAITRIGDSHNHAVALHAIEKAGHGRRFQTRTASQLSALQVILHPKDH
jgi:hypothetical protein